MTVSASRRTVIVPAGVPNRSTATKTNVSETDIRALSEATLTLKDPVSSVKAAMTTYCVPGGSSKSLYVDCATAPAPASTTAAT